MGSSLFFFLAFVTLPWLVLAYNPSREFVYPNFTTSFYKSIDVTGTFLLSPNGTFRAAMYSPGKQQPQYYLCVIYSESNTIVWSANRDTPVSSSGTMSLTSSGINITDHGGSFKWSTPSLQAAVAALQLNDAGNLVLLDHSNGTLWESYKNPTDTIVIGQVFSTGMSLISALSTDDLSAGDYSFSLTASDSMLQWKKLTYWKLSMASMAIANSNYAVDYLVVNGTGLYLFSLNGSSVVMQLNLEPAAFRTAKLDYTGRFIITSFSGSKPVVDFILPADCCRIPNVCGKLGLCSNGAQSYPPQCFCPSNFHLNSQSTTNCVPTDSSFSLPPPCNSTNNSSYLNSSLAMVYERLGNSVGYFSNDFTMPTKYGVNLSTCQDICSGDCTCFGVFFENSSGSCYVLDNDVGSLLLITTGNSDLLGFIKALVAPFRSGNSNLNGETLGFPVVGLVLLPFTGLSLLILLGFLLWRRSRVPIMMKRKRYNRSDSASSGDFEAISIPGLPVRFDYAELEAATENFKMQVGSGGFGAVYKGELPDKVVVAVKKINSFGIEGKKDFCTEIAVIGNIHHVNLVKLKGYCAQGRHRLLVYEYMNCGSLDRSLFGGAPVLEWQERVEIALGAARGLAYLHSGCDHKIIHCDVKPENILLHNNLHAKLSDFGLSKLLSPEQSTLFTTMRGTRGYLAPEWLTNSAISDKTDVYSFGMVLLEIVSGRKNCPIRSRSHSLDNSSSADGGSSSSSTAGPVYFPLFALEMHEQGRYLELADSRLEGRVSSGEVEKFVRVALCCVHEEPTLRPNMVSVVGMLEGEIPLCEPRMESLKFLRFYGLRFAEASLIQDTGNTRQATTRTGCKNDYSFISSQQVSGPR